MLPDNVGSLREGVLGSRRSTAQLHGPFSPCAFTLLTPSEGSLKIALGDTRPHLCFYFLLLSFYYNQRRRIVKQGFVV